MLHKLGHRSGIVQNAVNRGMSFVLLLIGPFLSCAHPSGSPQQRDSSQSKNAPTDKNKPPSQQAKQKAQSKQAKRKACIRGEGSKTFSSDNPEEEYGRKTWATEASFPHEPHPKAKVYGGDEFDWAPDDKRVILHTTAESTATRRQWEPLAKNFKNDAFRNGSARYAKSFGLVVDVPVDFPQTSRSRSPDGAASGEEDDQRTFVGFGGPFARNDVHLFECGSAAADEGEERTARTTWRVGYLVVRCRHPKLRVGIALDFRPKRQTQFRRWEHTYSVQEGRFEKSHCFMVEGEPPVPEVYREWWRELRRSVVRAWCTHRMELLEKNYWKALTAFRFELDGEEGARKVLKMELNSTSVEPLQKFTRWVTHGTCESRWRFQKEVVDHDERRRLEH